MAHAMQQLFTARWNIPQAAQAMGLASTESNWDAVKANFNEYCKTNAPTYNKSKLR